MLFYLKVVNLLTASLTFYICIILQLYRGDTTARVQDVAFATDSRWVAVTTLRGTTHVFPISPYGGSVGMRTHTSQRVVNRLSRFHRSAGLDDINPSSGRSSPVLSGSPGNHRHQESPALFPFPNPRLPPYPHPTVVAPLAQLRSSFMGSGASGNRGWAIHRWQCWWLWLPCVRPGKCKRAPQVLPWIWPGTSTRIGLHMRGGGI